MGQGEVPAVGYGVQCLCTKLEALYVPGKKVLEQVVVKILHVGSPMMIKKAKEQGVAVIDISHQCLHFLVTCTWSHTLFHGFFSTLHDLFCI